MAARFDVCCGLSAAEIVGFDSAELQWLKTLGVFSEYVQHRLRAFVPNDASAVFDFYIPLLKIVKYLGNVPYKIGDHT